MTLFHPDATTAAVTACVSIALLAGHMIGDHPVQRDTDAAGKGQPTDDRLAAGTHPHTGWNHCLHHVITYLACQGAALVVIGMVAPLSVYGAFAALAISGSTHAVIDRRWLVRAIIRAKGGCPNWAQAPYWTDQSLHYGAMFAAAVAAASTATMRGATVALLVSMALLATCLIAERRRGLALATIDAFQKAQAIR